MKNAFKTSSVLKSFKTKIFLGAMCLGISSFGFTVGAHSSSTSHSHVKLTETEKAFKLENRFWNAVKANDTTKLESIVSSIFQGLNNEGAFTRKAFITQLSAAKITEVKLNNFVATKKHHMLVVSYDLKTTGTGIVDGPVVSVYKDTDHGWKMISHSYLPTP